MTKKSKLRLCDWSLLFLTIAIFASGIQLEINPARATIWVWAHIIMGALFIGGIFWHIGLHKSSKGKLNPSSRNRRHKHALMGIFFLVTLVSGIVATCHWIGTYLHSTIGGIHGKFGFLFIIAVIFHIAKHRRFYYR